MLQACEDRTLPHLRPRKRLQNTFALNFAVAGQRPAEIIGIHQQAHAIPLVEESIRKRGRGKHGMIEDRASAVKYICNFASIQNNADIGDAFLLKFIGIQVLAVARAGAPVDRARGVSGLVVAHTEEFRANTAHARGDRPGIDARAPRSNGYIL